MQSARQFPADVIDFDAPCRNCGYNQRGLPLDHACPECGAPSASIAEAEYLRFADPRWVSGLVRGPHCMLLGASIGVMTVLIMPALRASFAMTLITAGAATLAISVYGYGVWLLTVPDPSGIAEARGGKSRRIGRAALLLGLPGLAAVVAVDTALTGWTAAAGLALAVLLVAGHLFLWLYLEKLCDRVDDSQVRAWVRLVRRGLVLGIAVPGAAVVVGQLMELAGFPAMIDAGMLIIVVLWVAGAFFYTISCMMFLMRLGMALGAESRVAQSSARRQPAQHGDSTRAGGGADG